MKNKVIPEAYTIVKEKENIARVALGEHELNLCGMLRPKEVNAGDEVTVKIYVCSSYDYSVDVRVDLLTFWNNSSITNYATVPGRPVNEKYSVIKISFTFIMPNESAAYCPGLFKRINNKWEFVPSFWPKTHDLRIDIRSTTPIGYESVIWDHLITLEYPFVCKVGAEYTLTFGFTNLGNQKCWQRLFAYFRWRDKWYSFNGYAPPWGTAEFFHKYTEEMPEEDAIIDLYLQHSENCDNEDGPYITTEERTITIKPIFNPGTIYMKNINTEESLVPGTKPDYLTLSAVVPPVNKIHLFAKDSILDKPVTDILTVEEAVEGNIEIDINPKTAFIKNMPNREWHLSLYGAADK